MVRNAHGQAVPDLRQEDFRVFEDGKLQLISHFLVEKPVAAPVASPETSSPHPADSEKSPAALVRPARFVALLFDDVHLPFGELAQIRNIADDYVKSSFQPSDRIAVFTISGQSQTDFTDDRAKLHEALQGVQPRPVTAGSATGIGDCPSINYFQADLIVNQHDLQAITVATNDALACEFGGNQQYLSAAQGVAQGMALQILTTADMQTQYSFQRLKEIVRRMTAVSGQRLVVLMSPGFLIPNREYDLSEIIDSATRSNVIISTLDARGLYTVDALPDVSAKPTGDAALSGFQPLTAFSRSRGNRMFCGAWQMALAGKDLPIVTIWRGGFRRLVAAPETSYLIGFVPQNLKYDGHFHSLKVALTSKEKYTVQRTVRFLRAEKVRDPCRCCEAGNGRSGSIAGRATRTSRFSFTHSITRWTRPTRNWRYSRTWTSGVSVLISSTGAIERFDHRGGAVRSQRKFCHRYEKVLEMRLRDTTLEKLSHTGVTVKTSFDVKPGAYLVRLVVRDSQAAQLSAENSVVEIPY